MVGPIFRCLPVLALGLLCACGEFGTGYFQGQVNQATQEVVAKRCGTLHKLDNLPDGWSVWTYFDRGRARVGMAAMCPCLIAGPMS